jgi:antitoxin (DNA-binding transcriptional repressor) of toxin-antitoxin stability system
MGTSANRRDAPRSVSIRELSRGTGSILKSLSRAKRPAVVTDRGRPIAIIVPTDPDEFEDFVLERAPEFIKARLDALSDVDAGQVRSLAEVAAELDGESERTDETAL